MTKEELEKEALAKYKTGSYPQLHPDFRAFIHGYLSAAEPREKHNIDLEKENEELKKQVEQKQHLADVRLEQSLENYKLFSDERKARIDVDIALEDTTDKLTYAKTIIQALLDNSDEYARQRAIDFLKEE